MTRKVWKSVMSFCLAFVLCFGMIGYTGIPTVSAASQTAKVSKKTLTLNVGEKKTLKVKAKPKGAKVTWKSANKKIASVTKKGVVKGIKPGKTNIKLTVKTKKKTYVSKCVVTVKKAVAATVPVTAVSADVTNKNMQVGESFTIKATVAPANATNKAVEFTSSNTSVATVSALGVVTAKKGGTATIKVSAKDGSGKYATIAVTVSYATANTGKVRTVVTTDGEVDDQDSFMRLMLYANEMDIAGLILSSSTYHYSGGIMKDGTEVEPYRWTGTDWAGEVVDNYAKVYKNLSANADGYPEPEYLKSILKIGNIKNVGDMDEATEGSNFLKDILLDNDDRTLYIQTWGGTNTTARALYDIEQQYKTTSQWDSIYDKVCKKAVIYIILNQDDTFAKYISVNWPGIKVIQDTGNFWRFAYMWKQVDPAFAGRLQGDWNYENIRMGHGPLLDGYHLMGDGTMLPGELDNEQRGSEQYLINNPQYNRYDFISEGDSPSFFYLLDTGLRSMEDPTFGGWGGRFAADKDGNYLSTAQDSVTGTNGTTKSTANTLIRWFNDIQDDFAARADWCVKSYAQANHRPTVKVAEGVDLTAKPGERVKLHASATDPDGDKVTYSWWQYNDADTYAGDSDGDISMIGAKSDTMSFVVPEDAQDGDTIHMIIEVKDDGAHNMTHYQRVIVTIEGRQEISSLSLEVPEGKDATAIPFGTSSGWSNPYRFNMVAKALNDSGEVLEGKTFNWEVDDATVATISSSGQFTPLKAGNVKVTITAKDGSGMTKSLDLTVVSES